mgnify:CR=1 FL=1
MKRIISLVTAVVLLVLTLTSCSAFTKVKVNGTGIDNEIYAYFEDLHDGNEGELKKAISRYVTINSEFHNRDLTLSSSRKAQISSMVDDLWHLYGVHYKSIGVSRQTVYKIEPSKAYEEGNVTAGVWNIMPVYEGDHMSLQGGLMKTNTDIRDLYIRHFDMINSLGM